MTGRLEGKAALITGSSKGIGKGIAETYLEQGASVFLCARGEERLAETAEELASRGEVAHLAADVADRLFQHHPDQVEKLISRWTGDTTRFAEV